MSCRTEMRLLRLLSISSLPLAMSVLPTETDWIVVGGGASGCTAAAALVDAKQRVVVVERGPSDLDIPSTESGDTWPKVVVDAVENIRWTDGPWGAVARVLGGGASVNDGYFFEEEPEFLMNLLKLSSEDLEAYYASSKYLAEQLLTPLPSTPLGVAYAQAVEMAGHGKVNFSDTSNIRYKDGAWVVNSLFNMTKPPHTRHTPALLLHKRANSPGLHIATDMRVEKVLFEGKRAVGVEVHDGSGTKTIAAKKGVIMAAGAIFTPQILQVSGVGEASHLSHLGVPQVADLPVGQNFVDRLTWSVQFATPPLTDAPHFLGYTVAADSKAGITIELVGGKDVDNQFAIASLGLAPAKEREAILRPVMKVLMDSPVGDIVGKMYNAVGLMQDTKSRGHIQATVLDTSTPPKVTANYFSNQDDLPNMVALLKALVNVVRQDPLAKWRTEKAFEPPAEELDESLLENLKALGFNTSQGVPDIVGCLFEEPKESVKFISLPCMPEEESQWGGFLRDNVLSTYHYFGTAAVGSVVEPGTFKVKGIDGLYVVDASVIPGTPRINPVGTIMTIGHFVGTKLGKHNNDIFV